MKQTASRTPPNIILCDTLFYFLTRVSVSLHLQFTFPALFNLVINFTLIYLALQ